MIEAVASCDVSVEAGARPQEMVDRIESQRPDAHVASGFLCTGERGIVEIGAVVVEVEVERQMAGDVVAAAEIEVPAGVAA